MRDVLPAEAAVLAQLEPFARLLLVLRRAVVAAFALGARQGDDVSHCWFLITPNRQLPTSNSPSGIGSWSLGIDVNRYSMISEIVPAPTVRPPSRIANRAPFSNAIAACSVASIPVLSPGITISTP